MQLSDCVKFANDVQVCSVATTEGSQPRVRIFAMWYADETGFYFHSGASKATCRQLKENPKLEVCFYAPSTPPDPGTMLRVSGEAEFLNDLDLKTRLLEERPFLRALGVTGPDDPNLAVFRIGTGEAYFWTMANNLRESEADRIEF